MKSIVALCAPSRPDTSRAMEFIKNNNLLNIVQKLAGSSTAANPFADISPFYFISKTTTLLMHDDADNIVDVSQSENLYLEL